MKNKFNLIIISLFAIIFSACGKTENKPEVEILQDTSTVDTICDTVDTIDTVEEDYSTVETYNIAAPTPNPNVERIIKSHEFYDEFYEFFGVFWKEFSAAAIAGNKKKIINEMMHFPLKSGYTTTGGTLSKKDVLDLLPDYYPWSWHFLRNSEKFQLINVDNSYHYFLAEKTKNAKGKIISEEQITINLTYFEKYEEEYTGFKDFCDEFEKMKINEKNVYRLFIFHYGWVYNTEFDFNETTVVNHQEYYFAKRGGKYKLIAFHWYSP